MSTASAPEPVGVIRRDPSKLSRLLGIHFQTDHDDLDLYRWASRSDDRGNRVILRCYAGEPGICQVLAAARPGSSPKELLNRLWPDLVPLVEPLEGEEPLPETPTFDTARLWRVRRQDDHGNTFDVGAFKEREEATRWIHELERRGHKQHYELVKPEQVDALGEEQTPPRQRDSTRLDDRVLEGVRQGDPEAITAVYEAFASRLLAYLLARVDDGATAEDLLEATFLELLTQRASMARDVDALPSWLFKTAHLNASTYTRRVGERARESVSNKSAHVLREHLRSLPDEEQEVLLLRYVAKLSLSEVGTVLGKSELAIEELQQRAERSLARKREETTRERIRRFRWRRRPQDESLEAQISGMPRHFLDEAALHAVERVENRVLSAVRK